MKKLHLSYHPPIFLCVAVNALLYLVQPPSFMPTPTAMSASENLHKSLHSPTLKAFICSTIKTFVFYLERGLENPRKERKLRKKFL